ncbi:MAG: hypothetical protein Kow0065_01050 [Methylomicrobium sp.]
MWQVLLLLLAANGGPVIAGKLFGQRGARPIDAGWVLADGYRLFGNTKTWRGLGAAIVCAGGLASVLSADVVIGALFGGVAMLGDLAASFCKRRWGLPESSRVRGLDTIPESLLPALVFKTHFVLTAWDIVIVSALFFLIEECISPVLYRLHIRKRPY